MIFWFVINNFSWLLSCYAGIVDHKIIELFLKFRSLTQAFLPFYGLFGVTSLGKGQNPAKGPLFKPQVVPDILQRHFFPPKINCLLPFQVRLRWFFQMFVSRDFHFGDNFNFFKIRYYLYSKHLTTDLPQHSIHEYVLFAYTLSERSNLWLEGGVEQNTTGHFFSPTVQYS